MLDATGRGIGRGDIVTPRLGYPTAGPQAEVTELTNPREIRLRWAAMPSVDAWADPSQLVIVRKARKPR